MIFLPHTEVYPRLKFSETAPCITPQDPPESFIFLRNFNDFPPHTEVYPRLKFCDLARGLGPPDPRIPSFSCGISMIFLHILRSTLGSNSAIPRCASAPPDPRIPSFSFGISMIFLPILRSTLGSNSASPRCASAPLTHEILHFPMEFQ